MANYIPISTVTVGSSGIAAIDFVGIPAIYTDLIIKISARGTNAAHFSNFRINLNGSSGTFSRREIYAENGSAGTETVADNFVGPLTTASATANTFGYVEIYIPNYTLAINKPFIFDASSENNATNHSFWQTGGLWSTTTPISSIGLYPNVGTFVQYSTATLYGIRKY
jgi:hypothetical protein